MCVVMSGEDDGDDEKMIFFALFQKYQTRLLKRQDVSLQED
jgi:hypothetical protein